MKQNANVIKAIAATAELTGTELSEAALLVFESDLAGYPEQQVIEALTRCRRELRGRLTVSDVIDRMSCAGAHPTANEAWGLALASVDESETVVWTDQIAEAAGIAQPILDAGDEVGARMAFRDAYERILREQGDKQPRWFASMGTDPGRRTSAIERAVRAGLLTETHAAKLLPAPKDAGPIGEALFEGKPLQLADLSPEDRERARKNIANLKLMLSGKAAA
jgi:hypothetical protein